MSIDLLALLKRFDNVQDYENQVACYRTLVPRVAPEAYLNIVFRGATRELLSRVAEKLRFISELFDFLQKQNGANLFAGELSIFGVVESGQTLNRSDRFSLPPFDIERENTFSRNRECFLAVGAYASDARCAYLDREDRAVYTLLKGQSQPIDSWNSLEAWIIGEVSRLAAQFDESGRKVDSQ